MLACSLMRVTPQWRFDYSSQFPIAKQKSQQINVDLTLLIKIKLFFSLSTFTKLTTSLQWKYKRKGSIQLE